METKTNGRGFRYMALDPYIEGEGDQRVAAESSAIDFDQEDGLENPGSSYLWIGAHHHLNRQEVAELRDALTHWLDNKRLPL